MNPLPAAAQGLMVYQTNVAGTSLEGFYYNISTTVVPNWMYLEGSAGWLLIGNAGTNPATNFLGTTDLQPLLLKTNALERMRIFATGEVTIGAKIPTAMFHDSVAYSGYAGRFENARNDGRGLLGMNILAAGANTLCHGVTGATSQSQSFGGRFTNGIQTGTGLYAGGNNVAGTYLASGSGGSINGDSIGLAVRAMNANGLTGLISSCNALGYNYYPNSGASFNGRDFGMGAIASTNLTGTGGYFTNGNGAGTFARVAYTSALAVAYKINGPGAVATCVYDQNNKMVDMFCPEAPEVLFQDFGEGHLTNGSCSILLDPVFSKNIFVDSTHPLRVYIQLNDNCNGVYVNNRSQKGFDVTEIKNGNSNATFTWFVSANRADDFEPLNGKLNSRFQDIRFPPSAPREQLKSIQSKSSDDPF